MIPSRLLVALLAFMPLFAADVWPTQRWKESTPEEQGVDSVALAEAIDYIVRTGLPVHSLLVVRHGVLVVDAYFYPYEPTVPHDIASVTKSVTSILTGIAIDQGYLQGVHQAVLPLLATVSPGAADPRRSRMTIENLLTMTSGLACGALNVAHTAETELDEMRHSADWIRYAVNLPMRSEPGRQFAYCSINNHLLSAIITARTGERLESFARRNLFAPLGIKELLWPVDPEGLNHGWGDLHLYPRDMAKLGYLYLRGGKWSDRQLVSEEWVRRSVASHAAVRDGVGYGYSWWINLNREPHIPEAEGRGGQRISIVPDKDAVVVFTSGGADTDQVAPYLLKALASDVPLAPNPAAFRRLTRSLGAARRSPKAAPVPAAPETASRVSGRQYTFGSNPLDLRALSLLFDGKDQGHVVVKIGNEDWTGRSGWMESIAFRRTDTDVSRWPSLGSGGAAGNSCWTSTCFQTSLGSCLRFGFCATAPNSTSQIQPARFTAYGSVVWSTSEAVLPVMVNASRPPAAPRWGSPGVRGGRSRLVFSERSARLSPHDSEIPGVQWKTGWV